MLLVRFGVNPPTNKSNNYEQFIYVPSAMPVALRRLVSFRSILHDHQH